MKPVFLGDFEQLILISILHLENDASALELKKRMETLAGRAISRGALYRTIDRMAAKDWIDWTVDDEERPERGGHPRRRFTVTKEGIAVVRQSRRTLVSLWAGIERKLR